MEDVEGLRGRIADGTATITIDELRVEDLDDIGWSGSPTRLRNVAEQLARMPSGDVEYFVLRADGTSIAKAGVDYTKERGAATIWQVATRFEFEGLGLATRLFEHAETRAQARGLSRLRLGVEVENDRARSLYEHLGFVPIGESIDEWEAETLDGAACLYRAICIEMAKDL
ncbi:MAG TPA: GNAT family N-acetyltransferase [Acidimicrobiales bacterium]|nr:GNAT family N-acetyltransferase [Acidimicrobiales bacterium]